MFYLLADFMTKPSEPYFAAASTARLAITRALSHINEVERDAKGLNQDELLEFFRDGEAEVCELVKIPEPMPKKRSDANFYGLYMKYWSGDVPNQYSDFKPEE